MYLQSTVVQMTLTIHKLCSGMFVCTESYLHHMLLSDFIQSGQDVQSMCTDLQEAIPCEGNGDQEFVD